MIDDTPQQPTEAEIKREWALLRQEKANYERTVELKKRVERWAKGVQDWARHEEIKEANRRLREEMASYRHKPDEAVPDDVGMSPASLPPAA